MVATWWASDCGDRSRRVQGAEGTPSPTVGVSLRDDQNDGRDIAPISGQTDTTNRKGVRIFGLRTSSVPAVREGYAWVQ